MSRYLVTGATGFLGRHLVSVLLSGGHQVVALCRKEPAGFAGKEGFSVARGDVLDAESVKRAAEGCEGLFHCAGRVSRRPEDAEALFRVHVEGTKITLDAARAAGVRRVVLASTSGTIAVSREAKIIDETALAPQDVIARWPYYRSKLYAERAGLDRSGPGFEVVSVNPSLLLGPGDVLGSSTGDVVKFMEKRVPMIPSGGLSFVDARDAAATMVAAMEKGRAGEKYLLGAKNLTFEAFFGMLERVTGVKGPSVKAPKSLLLAQAGAEIMERIAKRMNTESPIDRVSAEMSQHYWYLDAKKATRELGFSPRDAIETLSDTVKDLRERGVVWPKD
ncbi:NAD-dependent epimerase/dehydratase family protein [Polyangium sorediatum]|uniref:NAD-dependent epimerase/dehydratase family protein n=1 Tax=Polyangium sorediatum TaxID=889274 RepID=A0ABT6NTT1_9BACT|nr:NAD-dependent epimerase/dehydratase family protein [Polyangium sorediatum]MDI1431734.1 NAD-dependent epimerase/dehydratase family protein [Polyangium sorediatum]